MNISPKEHKKPRNECLFLVVNAKFRVFKQGNISINDYYCKMKGMDNDMRILSETITDWHLVLNLLHDLNKKYDHMKNFIKSSYLFPSFHVVRNDLELKEVQLDNSMA
jgi:hypothetical protein